MGRPDISDGSERPEPGPDGDRPIVISGDDARGGEIVLRTRRRRAVFISGLVGFVLLALVLWFADLAA